MKSSLLLFVICCLAFNSNAQFNITETFKNGLQGGNLVTGGSATFTSGISDPAGEGWLRLTDTGQNQVGYLYNTTAFPSTLGILLEFDFLAWKNSNTYTVNGADGICMFLWDGSVPFGIGASGGGLGYTPGDTTIPVPGAAGAYIGVGLDELGNFSNPTRFITNAQPLGGPGIVPDAVVIRNCADSNYYYMTHYALPVNTSVSNGDDGGIDYKGVSLTRPTSAAYYRNIQLEIRPEAGLYRIIARMKSSETGGYTELISFLSPTPPPPTLKIALAATTGSFSNFHEIRNLNVTTPGNISVLKDGPSSALAGDTITYKLTIRNHSVNTLNNILFTDSLPANFRLTGYTVIQENAGNALNSIDTANPPAITGSCNIVAGNEIEVLLSGYFDNSLPVPGSYLNKVYVTAPTGFTDNDPTNDTASVLTQLSGPLPLHLLRFEGYAGNGYNHISWDIARQSDDINYELQYSGDGRQFTRLYTVAPAPENNIQHYEYRHEGSYFRMFYRLLAYRRSAAVPYKSNVIALYGKDGDRLRLYPNPFGKNLYIEAPEDCSEIAVFDLCGSPLLRYRPAPSKYIQLPADSGLPSGVLLIRVTETSGRVYYRTAVHE